jgi:hypothetical protein
MNNWHNLMNSSLLIGLTLFMPIYSSAIPLPTENIAILQSKPLRRGEVKPDKPLPTADVKPTNKIIPSLSSNCLSQSQIVAMKTYLQEARNRAIKGRLVDAVETFNEFAGGPWEEAAKEFKIKDPSKYNDINMFIRKIDDISALRNKPRTNTKSLRLKFIKEVTNLINAVVKAGQDC